MHPFFAHAAPRVFAHRGGSGLAPENTIAAFDNGLALGADGLELDVHLSRDGVVVVHHDATVDRTTNGHGPIAAMDWAEVRALDAGAWRGERFAGARIPSLEDTIELIVGAGLLLCVEIKGTADDAPATAVAVARLIRDRGLLDQVFISSALDGALAAARAEVGSPLLAPERLPEAGPSDPATAVAQAVALDAAVLQHRWEDLTTDVMDALHAAGTAVWSWPIDTVESIQRSVELGCDGIIGDDVPLLLEGLGRAAPSGSAAAPVRP